MVFNGKGVAKDEASAATWFRRAALAGNPVGQNRLARMLAAGRGIRTDAVEAAKWHLLARQAGVTDAWLDMFTQGLSQDTRDKAKAAAEAFAAPLTGEPAGIAEAGPAQNAAR